MAAAPVPLAEAKLRKGKDGEELAASSLWVRPGALDPCPSRLPPHWPSASSSSKAQWP